MWFHKYTLMLVPGSVTLTIKVGLHEELCRIRSKDTFMGLICCENILHTICSLQRGPIMCFILGVQWCVFSKYKKRFIHLVTADVSIQEHLFHCDRFAAIVGKFQDDYVWLSVRSKC